MSQRITVRLTDALYERLLLFAEGRSQGHTPDVSAIVREALEQYLVPRGRQTATSEVPDTQREYVRHIKESP